MQSERSKLMHELHVMKVKQMFQRLDHLTQLFIIRCDYVAVDEITTKYYQGIFNAFSEGSKAESSKLFRALLEVSKERGEDHYYWSLMNK